MKLLLGVFLAIWGISSTVSAQFYVAPDGSDSNPGTRQQPLATLVGARNAIRKFKKEHTMTAPVVVTVRGGKYQMTQPLVLLPQDGGTDRFPVVYKTETGEKPVFSGGKRITGFTVNENGIWQADVPECILYKWRFDQLYVNGKRAVMARTPNSGYLQIDDSKQTVWERGTGRYAEKARQVFSFDANNFRPISQITDDELQIARFRVFHKWDFTLRFMDKIDRDSMRISTTGEGLKPWNSIGKGDRIVFENYAAALDTVGEWYLNSRGTLYYFPRPGETPENTEVIAPALESVISVEGDGAANHFVENIRFEGLAFEHCLYRMPNTGSEPNQAAAHIDAAVMLNGSRNVVFKDCEILKTGQHALWFKNGCSNCEVNHCYLTDLGGGGVYIGDVTPRTGTGHSQSIRLDNNIIQTGGQEFPSAVGVWVGHSSDNEITHNDIGNFYYTGVSVGWVWGYAESNAKRNRISFNNIHHIGWALLSDMAAVYTLGKSEGTVISNNVIHHVHAYSYGGWGLYTDEGSSGILMENNLVYSTKTGGFHQHYGSENTIRNNIFAFAKMYQLQCTRVEEHLSFRFLNNITIFNEGKLLDGAWKKVRIEMDSNLYWNTRQPSFDFAGLNFAGWKKCGRDVHSKIADPMFTNPEKYDFTFKNMRKARSIGFKPFDYSQAGVYGSRQWKGKASLPVSITEAFDREVDRNLNNKK